MDDIVFSGSLTWNHTYIDKHTKDTQGQTDWHTYRNIYSEWYTHMNVY